MDERYGWVVYGDKKFCRVLVKKMSVSIKMKEIDEIEENDSRSEEYCGRDQVREETVAVPHGFITATRKKFALSPEFSRIVRFLLP